MPRHPAEIVYLGWLTLAFVMVATGCFVAAAAPPNYFTRTWQMEQGLPQNKVTAVMQARDGYYVHHDDERIGFRTGG